MSDLKQSIHNDMKACMREGQKERLAAIRLIMAAMKQREVDERIELDDTQVITILDKLSKQRRESIEQYSKAQRDDLVAKEQFELEVIQSYLPAQLEESEIDGLIKTAIESCGASSMKDMGKVMGQLKPKLQGRADMGKVSGKIKALLS